MFDPRTEREAWKYWRWRCLRALVEPAADYALLHKIVDYFGGVERAFVQTSNVDGLHERAGMPADRIQEIHGCLGRLQCSRPCCGTLWPADAAFLARLRADPDWLPRCPECRDRCQRPNVMIFGDYQLVDDALDRQAERCEAFLQAWEGNWAVLEIGAGVVVPSIRRAAERLAARGAGLVRINPSEAECDPAAVGVPAAKYRPLVARSDAGLGALLAALGG